MFTGIVEEVGHVCAVKRSSHAGSLDISCLAVLEGTKVGDSICVNGVCLTVTALDAKGFSADVMPETFLRSDLGTLTVGSPVNLERALRLDARLGGHIVSGHIDGVGRIASLIRDENAVRMCVNATSEILRYVVEKGSVTLDGISLTVVEIGTDGFEVSLIPHTFAHTVLAAKHVGDSINIECDIIGKYIERLLSERFGAASSMQQGLSVEMLLENGF